MNTRRSRRQPAREHASLTVARGATAGGLVASQGPDVLPVLLRLLATARHEIDRHLNDDGVCIVCRRPWPCPTACLAEFTLGAL